MRRFLIGLLVTTIASACSSPEKQLDPSRTFITITYNDTTFEAFSRTDQAITGAVVSAPGDSIRFRIRTKKDALVAGVDITLHPASSRDEKPQTRRIGMPQGTLPMIGTCVACLEQLLRRARALGGDSVTIPVMFIGPKASLDVMTVLKNGTDSMVIVDHSGNPAAGLHLAVDSLGRISGGVIPLSGTRIATAE